MALRSTNETPQTFTAAVHNGQYCRLPSETPPKTITFHPVPSFAKIKRRKVLKAFQQHKERQISQEKPNNRLALDAVSTRTWAKSKIKRVMEGPVSRRTRSQMIDAPIISVTPPTEISVTPSTEIDVLIEVDVQVEERKVNPSRAIKRVLGSHVDETECPLDEIDKVTARDGYIRSKRLATIGAEADQDRKKLDVKKNEDEWAFLKWYNPHNMAKNEKKKNEEFDRLRKRGIQMKINESCRTRNGKKLPMTQSS